MAKVITTIAPENGMSFGDITAFKTDSFIGMWDGNSSQYIMLPIEGTYFEIAYLGNPMTLQALDDLVYSMINEHIEEVFADSEYKITLECGG